MTDKIKYAIIDYKIKVKKLVLKTALWTPLNSHRFTFMLSVLTLWYAFRCGQKIPGILRYKKAIHNSENNIAFVFNCFLSHNYDRIFPHLLAENPEKYLQYVSIEGKEYVRELAGRNTGVILISGHFGPMFRTLLFKEAFGIGVSSFSNAYLKDKVSNSLAKLHKVNSSYTYYAVGEEKQFQEGLLRKEWINFLNDLPLKKRESNNQTLFGKKIYLSELPFKLSLKYNIPVLFVGTTRIKRQYYVTIMPINGFHTQQEGLGMYLALVEKLLCRDPYASIYIAETFF
jgi:lauroyl/myristoyl acyltransferase